MKARSPYHEKREGKTGCAIGNFDNSFINGHYCFTCCTEFEEGQMVVCPNYESFMEKKKDEWENLRDECNGAINKHEKDALEKTASKVGQDACNELEKKLGF